MNQIKHRTVCYFASVLLVAPVVLFGSHQSFAENYSYCSVVSSEFTKLMNNDIGSLKKASSRTVDHSYIRNFKNNYTDIYVDIPQEIHWMLDAQIEAAAYYRNKWKLPVGDSAKDSYRAFSYYKLKVQNDSPGKAVFPKKDYRNLNLVEVSQPNSSRLAIVEQMVMSPHDFGVKKAYIVEESKIGKLNTDHVVLVAVTFAVAGGAILWVVLVPEGCDKGSFEDNTECSSAARNVKYIHRELEKAFVEKFGDTYGGE